MQDKLLKLKQEKSLYDIALEIGISESSLYNYVNGYKKVSEKTLSKIKDYLGRM